MCHHSTHTMKADIHKESFKAFKTSKLKQGEHFSSFPLLQSMIY